MGTAKGLSTVCQILLHTSLMLGRVLALASAGLIAVWLLFVGTKRYTDVSAPQQWGDVIVWGYQHAWIAAAVGLGLGPGVCTSCNWWARPCRNGRKQRV